jgi:transglutaminase-like putative cysteine protease
MSDTAPAAIHTPSTAQSRDVLAVTHTTTYRYAAPVHARAAAPDAPPARQPRHAAALGLADPVAAGKLRWFHDVFGNSIAMAEFDGPTQELVIRSDLVVERFGDERTRDLAAEIAPEARNWPFLYSPDDRADLGTMMIAQYPDPGGRVLRWGQGFVAAYPTPTLGLLRDINASIQAGFAYRAREEAGTQTPLETLDGGSGTCRDFAVLMIETCRAMGFGARLISGYLRVPEDSALLGAGSTHAWCEVYLPGAGWIAFDPTNGLMGSRDLIRVATVRDIRQAAPISGSFIGRPEDFLGMEVSVEVRRVEPGALPPA